MFQWIDGMTYQLTNEIFVAAWADCVTQLQLPGNTEDVCADEYGQDHISQQARFGVVPGK